VRKLAALAAVLTLAGACGGDDEPQRGLDAIDTPDFAPAEGASTTTQPAAEGTPGTSSPTPSAGGQASAETTTPGEGAPPPQGSAPSPAGAPVAVSFDDPVGDAVGGLDADPPPWTDLAGGSLEHRDGVYRLAVELGGDAPERAPGSETMNIASFFDIDDDGTVDHEIWVNLDGEGWGPVRYDDRGTVAPGAESGVTIEVRGRSVILAFPASVIGAPEGLRFSTASEYGAIEVIGTDFARRDDAPDDDQAVSFP